MTIYSTLPKLEQTIVDLQKRAANLSEDILTTHQHYINERRISRQMRKEAAQVLQATLVDLAKLAAMVAGNPDAFAVMNRATGRIEKNIEKWVSERDK